MRTFTTNTELRSAVEKYFNGTDNADDIGTWDTSQITDMIQYHPSNLIKLLENVEDDEDKINTLLDSW